RERIQKRGRISSYWLLLKAMNEAHRRWTCRDKPVAVRWVRTPAQADPAAVSDKLDRLRRDNDPCCCLIFLPTPSLDISAKSFDAALEEAIEAGVPMAVWLRQRAITPKKAEAELRKYVIKMAKLAELPSSLFQYRNVRRTGVGYLGEHLTLLWDDPRR